MGKSTTMSSETQSSTGPSDKPFSVCVFCGAHPGSSPAFMEAAADLAKIFHENSWQLVYGGGTVGLMGAVSRTLVSLSGPSAVHGIIPRALIRFEQDGSIPPESKYGATTVVEDMHARKAMMGKLSDAFIALPGGFGTMEELFEIVTWNQLGIHDCPIVVLNIEGYYDGLMEWMRGAIKSGFIKEEVGGIVVEAKSVDEVPEAIKNYRPAKGRYNLDWKNEGSS